MTNTAELGVAIAIPEKAVAVQRTEVGLLMERAMEGQMDMEAMKDLVALYKETAAIQARKEFDAALAAFQAECPQPAKNRKSQHATNAGTSKQGWYSSRAEIERTARPIASRYGLSWTWDTTVGTDSTEIVCILRHVAGHREMSRVTMPNEVRGGASPQQKMGIVQEYGMRYSLVAAIGIASDDADTDGAPPIVDTTPVDDEQLDNLQLAWDAVKNNVGKKKLDPKAFFAYFACDSLSALPASRYAEALDSLKRKQS